jgi:phenylacetate-CoA ligase
VLRFQLHWLPGNAFRFMVCLDPSLSPKERAAAVEAVRARLGEILARKRMDNVRFEIVATEDLPVNPRTRKFQLILDKRSA